MTAIPVVASVPPTSAVPHPPWFAVLATGLAWIQNTTVAQQYRITSADVLRIDRSNGMWSQPIIGPVPSGGFAGDVTSSSSTASLDAL